MYYDVDDSRSNKKTTFGIIVIRCLNVFINFWSEMIVAF